MKVSTVMGMNVERYASGVKEKKRWDAEEHPTLRSLGQRPSRRTNRPDTRPTLASRRMPMGGLGMMTGGTPAGPPTRSKITVAEIPLKTRLGEITAFGWRGTDRAKFPSRRQPLVPGFQEELHVPSFALEPSKRINSFLEALSPDAQ